MNDTNALRGKNDPQFVPLYTDPRRSLTSEELAFYQDLRRALYMAIAAIERFAEIEPKKCEQCGGQKR